MLLLVRQHGFNGVDDSVESDGHRPVSVRRRRGVETLQECQVVAHLRQVNALGWHAPSPPKQKMRRRRKEMLQRLSLTEKHLRQERQFAQLVYQPALRFGDGIHDRQVRLVKDDQNFPTFIASDEQDGFHFGQFRNLTDEPLKGFPNALAPQHRRRFHGFVTPMDCRFATGCHSKKPALCEIAKACSLLTAAGTGLWRDAEGGKERRQIVVNQLPEQSRAWMHALITGVAAGKFQAPIGMPKVRKELTQVNASLAMGMAVQAPLSQPRFHRMDSGVKSDRHRPIGIRGVGSVETPQEGKVVPQLRQVNPLRRHPSTPPKQEADGRRQKFVQRFPLTDQDVEAGRRCLLPLRYQVVQQSPFLLNDGIHCCIVPFSEHRPNFPTFIASDEQDGFHFGQFRNLTDEPLKGFPNALAPQHRRRFHGFVTSSAILLPSSPSRTKLGGDERCALG
jgi:hypothetical protein